MIVKTIEKYDDSFLTKRFANKYLGDQRTLRIGNIIAFHSPVCITEGDKKYTSLDSLNFCCEIPEISSYAGVCFQRLFITNVANILATRHVKEQIEVINNDIIIKKEHTNGGIQQLDGVVSLNQIRNIDGAILIYLGLYNMIDHNNSQPRSISLMLDEEISNRLMDSICENFYHLVNGIFLNTAKM